MIIDFPRPSRAAATLSDLQDFIELPWCHEMHVPAILVHAAGMRLAVQSLGEELEQSLSATSKDWLLSFTFAHLKEMAPGFAPRFRRELIKSRRLSIQHSQIHRYGEPKYAQPIAAGLKH
jgi:hypothetical protein